MPVLTRLQYLGVAKESTWGTGVSPTKWVPINSAKPEDVLNTFKDQAKRNNITKTWGVIPTTKSSTLDIDTDFFSDVLGFFLLSVFGKDTVTGTSPYTHKFGADSAQKSLTLQHFDGYEERQYPGMVVDEVSIKGDAEGVISASVKLRGKVGSVVTPSTATYSTVVPLVGSAASLSIGGSPNVNLFGFEITVKRENKLIFGAANSADPTKVVQGGLELTGKLTFDVENATEYGLYTGQTAQTIALTLGGTSSNSALITVTSARIIKASRDMGNESLRVDWEFEGVYNTTDAGPGTITLVNSVVSY